ncbi:MAG: hypothetical protein ACYC6M_06735 [Terriglobales bacterium]
MNNTMTFVIAAWGAVIATISLGWQIAVYTHERKRTIKMLAMIARLSGRPDLKLLLRITNLSKQPFVWSGWALVTDRAPDIPLVCLMREPRKRLEQYQEHGEVVDEPVNIEGKLIRVFAWDTTGKEWDLDKEQLCKLNNSLSNERA